MIRFISVVLWYREELSWDEMLMKIGVCLKHEQSSNRSFQEVSIQCDRE